MRYPLTDDYGHRRKTSVDELREGNVGSLAQQLTDTAVDAEDRRAVAKTLGQMAAMGRITTEAGITTAVSELILALGDKDMKIRGAAMSALLQFADWEESVYFRASDRLRREKEMLSRDLAAVKSANGWVDDSALERMESALQSLVRRSITITLVHVAVTDTDRVVRKRAEELRGRFPQERVAANLPAIVDRLIARFRVNNDRVNERAAQELQKIGKPAVDSLFAATGDQNSKVARLATHALTVIWNYG